MFAGTKNSVPVVVVFWDVDSGRFSSNAVSLIGVFDVVEVSKRVSPGA